MTYSSMDDKRRVYDRIRLPHIFLGSPDACACNVYQALSPPPLEGPGHEATGFHAYLNSVKLLYLHINSLQLSIYIDYGVLLQVMAL